MPLMGKEGSLGGGPNGVSTFQGESEERVF